MATIKKLNNEEQARRFAETARALGCDEDEGAFRDKLRVIARQKMKNAPDISRPARRKASKPD